MATLISTITPEQLHAAQLRRDRPALLDVRTAAEYRAGPHTRCSTAPYRGTGTRGGDQAVQACRSGESGTPVHYLPERRT